MESIDVEEKAEIIPGITKRCTKCGEVKVVGEFYKCKNFKDGIQYRCKLCQDPNRGGNKEEKNAKKRIRENIGSVIGVERSTIQSVIVLSRLEKLQKDRRKIMLNDGMRYCKECQCYYPVNTHFLIKGRNRIMLCDNCLRTLDKNRYEKRKEYFRKRALNYYYLHKEKMLLYEKERYARKKSERLALTNVSPEV